MTNVKIIKKKGESIEHLISRFEKSVQREKIIAECETRESYTSPSEKRKRKSEKARIRASYDNNKNRYKD